MLRFTIKRGDTSPGIRFALSGADTLAGASVRFQMRRYRGPTVLDAAAEIVAESPPVVAYAWQPADTAFAGRFEAEFRVEYPSGAIETFPNSGFIDVFINPDVEDLP